MPLRPLVSFPRFSCTARSPLTWEDGALSLPAWRSGVYIPSLVGSETRVQMPLFMLLITESSQRGVRWETWLHGGSGGAVCLSLARTMNSLLAARRHEFRC